MIFYVASGGLLPVHLLGLCGEYSGVQNSEYACLRVGLPGTSMSSAENDKPPIWDAALLFVLLSAIFQSKPPSMFPLLIPA
jgi:hypothetical protein